MAAAAGVPLARRGCRVGAGVRRVEAALPVLLPRPPPDVWLRAWRLERAPRHARVDLAHRCRAGPRRAQGGRPRRRHGAPVPPHRVPLLCPDQRLGRVCADARQLLPQRLDRRRRAQERAAQAAQAAARRAHQAARAAPAAPSATHQRARVAVREHAAAQHLPVHGAVPVHDVACVHGVCALPPGACAAGDPHRAGSHHRAAGHPEPPLGGGRPPCALCRDAPPGGPHHPAQGDRAGGPRTQAPPRGAPAS